MKTFCNKATRMTRINVFLEPLLLTLNRYCLLGMLKRTKVNSPFHATCLFLYPLEASENLWFLMVSGDIERDLWHEMG